MYKIRVNNYLFATADSVKKLRQVLSTLYKLNPNKIEIIKL